MKNNTKSSITLPPKELELVELLRKRLGVKTKVEVIRRGLNHLKEYSDREALRLAFKKAAEDTRSNTLKTLKDLDHLTGEGVGND